MTFAADTSKTNNESGALPTAGSIPNTPFHYAGATQPIQDMTTISFRSRRKPSSTTFRCSR